ncbi:helix-turn-helix transcriptional regulator [Aeromonas media]|uniref:helix-turn-helix transcriptional regulator n=1 Tax=Aeromonas media TaxID=651 RepID=UPI0038CFA262
MTALSTQLITEQAACELLGISRPTIYRWRKDLKGFPKPIHLGPRAIRYELAVLLSFIEQRKRGKA